jgi:hypothetical protein
VLEELEEETACSKVAHNTRSFSESERENEDTEEMLCTRACMLH